MIERWRVPTSGGELSYSEYGDGPALLMLHGFPTSSIIWRELVPLLGIQMRVIAPDLMGYGRSDKPVDADLSPSAQAGYLRELLAARGVEELAVVGHDLGGAVAQLLALEGGVRTLVLIDSVAFEATRPEIGSPEAFLDGWVERAMSHRERVPGDLRHELLEPFTGEAGAGAFHRACAAIHSSALPDERALASIDAPTLLLWGEDDPINPVSVADRLNEAILGSSLALLPGCSHLLTHDAPETVGQLLHEYLRSRYLGAGHEHAEPGGPVPIALTHRPEGP